MSPLLRAQSTTTALANNIAIINAGCNVLAVDTSAGIVLVDSGIPARAGALQSALQNFSGGKVSNLFNTHWHDDQCGNNALFGEQGATITAHMKTRLHLGTTRYLPREERYFEAYPDAALPTDTFYYASADKTIGGESIEYGYLVQGHTNGDIYVYFRSANVIAVGDVVSPERDPAFDWYGGGWIGGRVDSLDTLLNLVDDETRIVPAYGPVIGKAELQAERDMMTFVYDKTVELVRQGMAPEHMLADGFMDALPRKFDDPYRFLYDLSKGLWAHHNKLAPNVV